MLQLEVGKSYRTNNKSIVKIIRENKDKNLYPFESQEGSEYTKEGHYIVDEPKHKRSLVSEVKENFLDKIPPGNKGNEGNQIKNDTTAMITALVTAQANLQKLKPKYRKAVLAYLINYFQGE